MPTLYKRHSIPSATSIRQFTSTSDNDNTNNSDSDDDDLTELSINYESEANSKYSLSSSEEDENTDEELDRMSESEINNIKYLGIFDTHSHFDEEIMITKDVDALKQMESTLKDRTKRGYYRCKTLHRELYDEMLIAYSKYCTPAMLIMLQHEFSTQKNEAMNHSVATLAPKTKTFSKSSSLLTRVMICGATRIVGHHEVWTKIFTQFNLNMDSNLSRHFQRKDDVKLKRQLFQKTKEYKTSRSQNRYVKYAAAHVSQLEEMKTGVMYQTGVAVKAAKKISKTISCSKESERHATKELEMSLLSQRLLFQYWA